MSKNNWTREQTIVAMNVYCKIPFKDSSSRHPLIIEYANLIGRTPASLNLKIGNLGSLDPILKAKGIVGLAHSSKMDEQVWNEFFDNPESLAYESERIIATLRNKPLEESVAIELSNLPLGTEREVLVRQRVNQQFFREAVLCSYENRCCISGISNPILLEACHISSWQKDVKNRTNPRNGLCMNPLFHKAYDKFLFSITPDYVIDISQAMIRDVKEEHFKRYLTALNNTKIGLPEKFLPDRDLLATHHEHYKQIMF